MQELTLHIILVSPILKTILAQVFSLNLHTKEVPCQQPSLWTSLPTTKAHKQIRLLQLQPLFWVQSLQVTQHCTAFSNSSGTKSVLQLSSRWVTSEAWNYTRKRDYLPRSYTYCLQNKTSSDPTDKDINKIVYCDGSPLVSFHKSVLSWLKQSWRKSSIVSMSAMNSNI